MNKKDEGRRVRLIYFDGDDYSNLKPGDLGTAGFYDDLGTLHVEWDNGERLGLIPGADEWTFIKEGQDGETELAGVRVS